MNLAVLASGSGTTLQNLIDRISSKSLDARINIVIASSYGLESLYAPDAGLFLLVFVLAGALGVVSGLLPARRAARVDPVIVLREA